MKKILFFILFLTSLTIFSQKNKTVFKDGEFLKFKITYGLINAGFASLKVEETVTNNESMHHVIGKGWTIGMTHFFFPVKDDYQTYISKKTSLPYRFIRKIREGSHTKNKEIFFNHKKQQAKVLDYKHDTEKLFTIEKEIQDMLSTLYYLRSLDLKTLKKEEAITVNMFLDNEIIKFKLIFKGRELIKTKFGKVKTLVFSPTVQEGRVFKENESVTLWITDDANKIPIKIKASILIGSLKAELVTYKGLANSFPIIF
ncbi:MAG: DUF3108 domain-containing protein [Flavobacteriaceae bacterium]|nr:DUF3108 domain-containing protein [Flavobacteriaceae bacterium]